MIHCSSCLSNDLAAGEEKSQAWGPGLFQWRELGFVSAAQLKKDRMCYRAVYLDEKLCHGMLYDINLLRSFEQAGIYPHLA